MLPRIATLRGVGDGREGTMGRRWRIHNPNARDASAVRPLHAARLACGRTSSSSRLQGAQTRARRDEGASAAQGPPSFFLGRAFSGQQPAKNRAHSCTRHTCPRSPELPRDRREPRSGARVEQIKSNISGFS